MVCPASSSRLSRSLTRFFGSSTRGRFQVSLVLSSSRKPRATCSASPRSICGAGGAGRAERETAELQPRRCRRGALLDQLEGEGLGLLVLVVLHHLEPVDDRADRADQVMADPRAQQRREIEGFEDNGAGHAGLRKNGVRGLIGRESAVSPAARGLCYTPPAHLPRQGPSTCRPPSPDSPTSTGAYWTH